MRQKPSTTQIASFRRINASLTRHHTKIGILVVGFFLSCSVQAQYEPKWEEYIEVNEFSGRLERAGATVINPNAKSGVFGMKVICVGLKSEKQPFLAPIVFYKGKDAKGGEIAVEYRVDEGAITTRKGLVDAEGVAGILHTFTNVELRELGNGNKIALRVTGREVFVGSFTLRGFATSYIKLSEVCK